MTVFIPTKPAAKRLSISHRTLEKMRCTGGGPPFHKFGGKVLYAEADLEAWATAQRRVSTSDTGIEKENPAGGRGDKKQTSQGGVSK
jgi:hypothetical protein